MFSGIRSVISTKSTGNVRMNYVVFEAIYLRVSGFRVSFLSLLSALTYTLIKSIFLMTYLQQSARLCSLVRYDMQFTKSLNATRIGLRS